MKGSLRFLPLAATTVTIAVNVAANALPINGVRTGELAALYPTGFTPPGWVFSIWGLVWLALLAFSFWCAFAAAGRRAQQILAPFLVSCAANVAWIFAWHHRLVAMSFAMMVLLFLSLAAIYVRLSRTHSRGWQERMTVDAPFSLYFGWVTTAAIVNLAALLSDLRSYPFGLTVDEWAVASLVAAVAIYAAMLTLTRDVIYGAVFVWAATGIALQATGAPEAVRVAAGTGALAVAVLIVISVLRLVSRRRLPRVY